MDEPLSTLPRAPGAALGTAHLAWGVAIVLGLMYAAQQMPVSSTPLHERLALATFFVGLSWLAAIAWRHVERGWQLRRQSEVPPTRSAAELLAYLAVGLTLGFALARQSQSRVLAAGLDRLISAALTVAAISIVLWIWDRRTKRKRTSAANWPRLEVALATMLMVFVAVMEFAT